MKLFRISVGEEDGAIVRDVEGTRVGGVIGISSCGSFLIWLTTTAITITKMATATMA